MAEPVTVAAADRPTKRKRSAPIVPAKVEEKWAGTQGYLTMGDLQVLVIVKKVRNRWGHIDLLVEPVGGKGTQWIQSTRIRPIRQK